MNQEPLRLGILSSANIAHGFCEGNVGSPLVRIDAVGSRSAEAAAAFAARHGIPREHASYEALLEDPALDAIYNPLPNSMHAEWTERALRAGKHVLCEKPLSLTLAEARRMFATAREAGRVLLEAYPYRYQPQTIRLRELVAEGAIGEVRLVQSFFGFSLGAGPNIRLDPALGGGGLLDAGCYAVSLARIVAGRRPLSVTGHARLGASGVDLGFSGTVHYEGGAMAQVGSAMDVAPMRCATVFGSNGSIETDYLNHTTDARPGRLLLRRGRGWDDAIEPVPYERGNGFRFEAEHFARLVRAEIADDGGDTELSLQNMATLEALLLSAREGGRRVEVAGG